jgi:lipopolysaccharide biosynthesis regulator YciM
MKKFNFIILFLLNINLANAQLCTIKETNTTFKTYPFSDPNPVAKVDRIYPYYRFDGFTENAIQKQWKTIELENDYIKLTILPEIGGKIWGAFEKSKNFPFVYYNHVVKFRDIAMRGAWTSGGIEINFGDIGHAPTCSSPVDYFTKTNDNGSVSCFLSATDLSAGTIWTVEVNLEKNKAYFTTKATWHNASPLETSYYHWMNAGFKAKGNLEFNFEGSNYIGHGGELFSWKKDSAGREINFYEKNNFGSYKSYHVLGKKSDYFGGYWHDDEMGFGHYSNYSDKLGKKIWIWGLSREGMIWEKLLTDTDGQYVELQSGRLFNQASPNSIDSPFKFVSFMPYATDSWSEYWFPVNGTKGVTNATNQGAINFSKDKLYFCALEKTSDSLKIYSSNKLIFSKLINLKPLEKIELDFIKPSNIIVKLGNHILYNESESESLSRPKSVESALDYNSEYGMFLKGKSLSNQRNYKEAKVEFEKLILKNANYVPALAELAQIAYRNADYKLAANYLSKALGINTYDAQSNFLWGLANQKLDNKVDAIDGFSVAALSPNYRSGSLLHLAEIHSQNADWQKAKEFAEKCKLEFPLNISNQNLLLTINRQLNIDCTSTIEEALKENPLNHLVRAELFLLKKNSKNFSELIRNEFPHQTYLEVAKHYENLGLYADALIILEISPAFPLVSYHKAFLKNKLGLNYNIDLQEAYKQSIELVFPFENNDIKVIEWAQKVMPNTKNNYYLGLLYWKNEKINEAKNQFALCIEFENVSNLLANAELNKNDKKLYETLVRKSYQLEPKNWRVIKMLIEFLTETKNYKEALTIAEKANSDLPTNYVIGQIYAQMLSFNHQYSKAIVFMNTLRILPNEGASETIRIYKEINILEAIEQLKVKNIKNCIKYLNQAETYPENLGSGMPYNPSNGLINKMKKALADKVKIKMDLNFNQEEYPFLKLKPLEVESVLWNQFVLNYNKI